MMLGIKHLTFSFTSLMLGIKHLTLVSSSDTAINRHNLIILWLEVDKSNWGWHHNQTFFLSILLQMDMEVDGLLEQKNFYMN
jgi:hypothetical protein